MFRASLGEVPHLKTAKVRDTATEGSAVSTRDDAPRGFIVTILGFSRALTYSLSRCSQRAYQSLIADPYTATTADDATRNKRDPLRINCLKNGMLLCLCHHKAYNAFRFSPGSAYPLFSSLKPMCSILLCAL